MEREQDKLPLETSGFILGCRDERIAKEKQQRHKLKQRQGKTQATFVYLR